MEIFMLEMQANPKFKPSTRASQLDNCDDLYYAYKKVALDCDRIGQESTAEMQIQRSDDCLARPVLPKLLTLLEFDYH